MPQDLGWIGLGWLATCWLSAAVHGLWLELDCSRRIIVCHAQALHCTARMQRRRQQLPAVWFFPRLFTPTSAPFWGKQNLRILRCWFLIMGEWSISCGCWRVISDLGSSGVTRTLAGEDVTVDLMELSAGYMYTFSNL
ncbi:hypothetical protein HDV64DRAFT_163778 [Trichoderma sp. TUCIM 5745]